MDLHSPGSALYGEILGTRSVRVEEAPALRLLEWVITKGTKREMQYGIYKNDETFDEWMVDMGGCEVPVVDVMFKGVIGPEGRGMVEVRGWEVGIYGFIQMLERES